MGMTSFKRGEHVSYYDPDAARAEVDEFILKWQGILGLDNWEISTEIVHSEKIEGCMGNSSWCSSTRRATIKISFDAVDDRHGCELEETVVHELLHVYFHMSYDLIVSRLLEKIQGNSVFDDLCSHFIEKSYENDIEGLSQILVNLQKTTELLVKGAEITA